MYCDIRIREFQCGGKEAVVHFEAEVEVPYSRKKLGKLDPTRRRE